MKYFTREWVNGGLPDAKALAIEESYLQHVQRLLPQLPSTIAELAASTSLHDGLIRRVRVNKRGQSVQLELLCGDQQHGYVDLDLLYHGVDFKTLELETLARLTRDRRVEILRDEIDQRKAGGYEHRMLFWPEGELTILFEELRLSKRPRRERSIPYVGDPYEEIGVQEGGAG